MIDGLLGWDHWSLLLTAGWLAIDMGPGQLWLCSAKSCKPLRTENPLPAMGDLRCIPLLVKEFFLMSSVTLPSHNLWLLLLVEEGFGSTISVTPLQVVVGSLMLPLGLFFPRLSNLSTLCRSYALGP